MSETKVYDVEHGPAEEHEVQPVHVTGDNDEYVQIGRYTKVKRADLMAAFGGDLRPGMYAPTPETRHFASPSPLGLLAFATTTFVLSLINVHARHVTEANIVCGLAFFYGGAVQMICGFLEMFVGNDFAMVALASYGGFWLSFAAVNTDAFGIVAAYGGDAEQLGSVLGFYLFAWFILTSLLCVLTIRSTVAFFGLFFSLSLTFLLLACAELTGKVGVQKAGGWIGLLTCGFAYYNAFAGLATYENSFLNLKPIPMPGRQSLQKWRDGYKEKGQKAN